MRLPLWMASASPDVSPIPAYWLSKLVGSTSRSVASPTCRCDQLMPPSVDLKIPRGGTLGGKTAPPRPANPKMMAARTMSGFVGCTLMPLKVRRGSGATDPGASAR